MEPTNTGGQRTGSGSTPQDRRKDEEAGKKAGQPSQGGSSQDRQSGSERGGSSGSPGQNDRLKDATRSGSEQSSGKSGQAGQSKHPDQSDDGQSE